MAELEGSIVGNMVSKGNCTKITFKQAFIFEHAAIYRALTREKPDFVNMQDLRLEQLIVTIGGYDTGYGFQYTIGGVGNPDTGKRSFLKEYPKTLTDDCMVSEIGFSFFEKNKGQRQTRYRMRFVNDFVEIRPAPSQAIIKEIVESLKQAILTNESVFLSSAKEKLRAAKISFLKGFYREAVHNIYYSMMSATQALQAKQGFGHRIDHSKLGKTIDEALLRIQQASKDFKNLNCDTYSSTAEEARELRELADYGIGFEAGGSEKHLTEMLSKAEELLTITDYVINRWLTEGNEGVNLHFPPDQQEDLVLEDSLDSGADYLFSSMLLIADYFDATIFAYKLLSLSNVNYTDFSENLFDRGYFAKRENGRLTFREGSEEGFLELRRENVEKWSHIVKPPHLEFLATVKEEQIQRLNLYYKGCYLSLYIFPDGRIYFFSRIDGTNFGRQLSATVDFEGVLKKIVELEYVTPSIFLLHKEVVRKR